MYSPTDEAQQLSSARIHSLISTVPAHSLGSARHIALCAEWLGRVRGAMMPEYSTLGRAERDMLSAIGAAPSATILAHCMQYAATPSSSRD